MTIAEWVIGLIVAVLIAGLVIADRREEREWDAFKAAHACRVTAKKRGETIVVGNQVGGTSDQTGWTCDDGITYFR